MRIVSWAILATFALTCGSAPQIANPQAATPVPVSFKAKPYSATRTWTTIQKMPDGTSITHSHKSLVWRDAEGRTRQDDIDELPASFGETHSVNVWDRVNRLALSWSFGEHLDHRVMDVVYVLHLPESDNLLGAPSKTSSAPLDIPPITHPCSTLPVDKQQSPCSISEALPPLTIDGIFATGRRLRLIIPVGTEGNDQVITVTLDSWKSQDLGITIRSVHDDPRTAKVTIELSDIKLSDPDPSLFQPPQGWRLQDMPQKNEVVPQPAD